MHKSYLEFGFEVEDLLFKGLTIKSGVGMVGLCISVAIFTFMYETIKTLRQKLVSSLGKTSRDFHYMNESHSERSMLVEIKESQQNWNRIRVHTIHAFLYMIQVTMGYFLMLIIMSYNAWLAITVFTAAGFSYYFYSTFVLYRPTVVPIEILSPEEYDQ
ncbi:high affinity copper uptake protein 1-like [Argiope bruennichi]|uniref:high affinity copper uptake protein 1-like n=1 Tax=Argiope bruennichi TaxID=94029 RepID=UPI002494AD76|nr:high affinity copper uptake protein 1-like [Argiope bruennichi]